MTEEQTKELVKSNFGRSASAYASSKVHAKGASLGRLVDLIDLQSSWRALDIATGAGHTALALAPYVDWIIASDLTPEMLAVTDGLASSRQITNLETANAAADKLPFPASQFDLVTCRIAAHHFSSIQEFVSESRRLLRPGGLLAVVDNIVPGGSRNVRGSKLRQDTGRYINAFDKLRDPGHVRTLSEEEWAETFYQNGFRIIHRETLEKQLDFESWARRMYVSDQDMVRLRAMLVQSPIPAKEYFKPTMTDGRLAFNLTELIIIGAWEP